MPSLPLPLVLVLINAATAIVARAFGHEIRVRISSLNLLVWQVCAFDTDTDTVRADIPSVTGPTQEEALQMFLDALHECAIEADARADRDREAVTLADAMPPLNGAVDPRRRALDALIAAHPNGYVDDAQPDDAQPFVPVRPPVPGDGEPRYDVADDCDVDSEVA